MYLRTTQRRNKDGSVVRYLALADPLALFVLPRVARCRLIEAMAQLETEAHKQGRKDATQARAEQEGLA